SIPFRAERVTTTRTTLSAVQVLGVVASGYLLASWAMNPVSAILPTITSDLNIDVTRAGWLMNSYFVLLVSFVLIAGRLGDAFGHGTVFRAGTAVFAIGSLVAALLGDFTALVVARGIQGLGSAMIFGTSLAIIATVYKGPRLAWAVGLMSVSAGVASMAGTWISTTLVQYSNWHFSFLVPTIIGVVVAVFARGLPSVRRTRLADIDWLGGVLLLGALAFLLLGLNHLHEGPETFEAGAPYHLSMHLVALTFLVAFVVRQLHARRPLVKLSLLGNAHLSAGVIANGIAHSSMLATSLLIPFLIERGRGYTPVQTQQLMLAMTMSLIVFSGLGGWLYARSGSPAIGVASIGGIAGGLWLLGRIGAELPFESLFPVVVVLGAGLGIVTAVNNTAVMSSVSSDQHGFASGMVETTRQLGHSLGVSISSGVLQASLAAAAVPALGYRDGFSEAATVMGVVAAIGVLIVLYPLVSVQWSVVRRH
ncbi:MAG TPA: MFS transporter, partial [Chloroflexota bacterium]|nr:MFS transporter [Chloroflexota bacterium]